MPVEAVIRQGAETLVWVDTGDSFYEVKKVELGTEVMALDGVTTRSEHLITVRRVEVNAAGGLAGSGVAGFATGGAVGGFPRLAGGSVPGTGDGDSVARTRPLRTATRTSPPW